MGVSLCSSSLVCSAALRILIHPLDHGTFFMSDTWTAQDGIQGLLMRVLVCMIDFTLRDLVDGKVELS